MALTEEEKQYYLQQCKHILLYIAHCAWILIISLSTLISIGLLLRFLRLKFGSRIKPSADRVIVITGATSGIGLALAKRFHRKGFTVFATHYNNQEPGYGELSKIACERATDSKAGQGAPRLFLVHMDVRSKQSIDVAATEIERLTAEFRLQLYCVICNAGVANESYFEINKIENMETTIQTNLLGVVLVAKRFILPIIKSKGRIVVTSSGLYGAITPPAPIYSPTKAAVKSFADCLNENLKRYGASCRNVVPGNLINKSNIMMSALRSFEDAVDRLSPEERELYREAIEENGRALRWQMELRVSQLGEDPKELADAYKVDLSAFNERKTTLVDRLYSFLDGSDSLKSKSSDSLGEMGALTAYDQAVCMKNPPRRCYCGNMSWQYITGPLVCEYTPQIVATFLYHLLENRLRGKVN